MKFTCEKNALVSAISVASRTVAQKSTIPALEGIYIRAGVKLTLSGYNLETGITISVDADIQETGACIMPSRLFFDIIRKLPDDTVSISVDENFKVSIRGGISSFSITAMSSEQKQLANQLENKTERKEGPFTYIEGNIKQNTIILMQCGIGKVNAAAGTVELIRNFQPDCIISTGVAGGIA